MLVLVVHSVHVHAAPVVHDDSLSAVAMGQGVSTVLIEAREFFDHAGAMAGCMTFEFSAPRVCALALATSGVPAVLAIIVGAHHNASRPGRVEIARPPPGIRRQALLGVFLN
jgi:hypothetical protein